jgi:hypothetical protein
VFCRFTLDYSLKNGLPGRKSSKNRVAGAAQTYRAEDRLIPMIPAVVAFPAGLLIYGWSLERGVHWIVPTLATALIGFSLSSSTAPIMSYLIDIFGDRSASAVAAAIPLRYILGAFLPVAAPYMYNSMGQGWACTFLALTISIASAVPLLIVVEPSNMAWVSRLTEKKPRDTEVT